MVFAGIFLIDNVYGEEPIISVQIEGNSTFYLDSPNKIIRASVEIQNYTPSDGYYFMRVTHLPTQKVMKDFEIYPKYFGNDLWGVKIAYPILESDIQVGDQTLFGEYELKIRTEFGSQTASTKFFILESSEETSTPLSKPEVTQSEINIDAHVNKSSYEEGETITVEGGVNQIVFGGTISLRLIAPNGNVIFVDQLLLNSDGQFTNNLDTNRNLFKENGDYIIQLIYGSDRVTTEILFSYENEIIIPPEPVSEPKPKVEQPTPKVEDPKPKVEESVPKVEKSNEKNNDIVNVPTSNQNEESDQNFIIGLSFLVIVFTAIIIGVILIKNRRKPKVESVSDDYIYDTVKKEKEEKMKWEGV